MYQQQIGLASPLLLAWLFMMVYKDKLELFQEFKYSYRTSFVIAYVVFFLWEMLALLVFYMFVWGNSIIPEQLWIWLIVLLILSIVASWIACRKILFKS